MLNLKPMCNESSQATQALETKFSEMQQEMNIVSFQLARATEDISELKARVANLTEVFSIREENDLVVPEVSSSNVFMQSFIIICILF